jgi:hypothetical protein
MPRAGRRVEPHSGCVRKQRRGAAQAFRLDECMRSHSYKHRECGASDDAMRPCLHFEGRHELTILFHRQRELSWCLCDVQRQVLDLCVLWPGRSIGQLLLLLLLDRARVVYRSIPALRAFLCGEGVAVVTEVHLLAMLHSCMWWGVGARSEQGCCILNEGIDFP